MDSSRIWLALTTQAHPTTALDTVDGYSILLTPEIDKMRTGIATSESEESSEQEQPDRIGIGMKVKDTGQRKGLQNVACFRYSDSVVGY